MAYWPYIGILIPSAAASFLVARLRPNRIADLCAGSGIQGLVAGAPPTPDATRGPGVKSLATDLESAQGSEPTVAVLAPKTPGPGPPVETPKSATKSVTPSKPKKKSLLKTLASPI